MGSLNKFMAQILAAMARLLVPGNNFSQTPLTMVYWTMPWYKKPNKPKTRVRCHTQTALPPIPAVVLEKNTCVNTSAKTAFIVVIVTAETKGWRFRKESLSWEVIAAAGCRKAPPRRLNNWLSYSFRRRLNFEGPFSSSGKYSEPTTESWRKLVVVGIVVEDEASRRFFERFCLLPLDELTTFVFRGIWFLWLEKAAVEEARKRIPSRIAQKCCLHHGNIILACSDSRLIFELLLVGWMIVLVLCFLFCERIGLMMLWWCFIKEKNNAFRRKICRPLIHSSHGPTSWILTESYQ